MNEESDALRASVLQTAKSISQARQRADQELLKAKEALEVRTRELTRSLAVMHATLESTTDGILVTDTRGQITFYNGKFAEMWRVPRELIKPGQEGHLRQLATRQLKAPELFAARLEEILTSSPPETFDVLEFTDGRAIERYSRPLTGPIRAASGAFATSRRASPEKFWPAASRRLWTVPTTRLSARTSTASS